MRLEQGPAPQGPTFGKPFGGPARRRQHSLEAPQGANDAALRYPLLKLRPALASESMSMRWGR